MVENAPPINPSQVFLGDSLIRGVRPKKKPNIYAMMSLHIIIETGTRNLNYRESIFVYIHKIFLGCVKITTNSWSLNSCITKNKQCLAISFLQILKKHVSEIYH